MCGVMMQLRAPRRGLSARIGSTETTSTAAPAKCPRVQRLSQRRLVHESAARHVDEQRRRFHAAEQVAIHEARVVGGQRTVQADDVGPGEQLRNRGPRKRVVSRLRRVAHRPRRSPTCRRRAPACPRVARCARSRRCPSSGRPTPAASSSRSKSPTARVHSPACTAASCSADVVTELQQQREDVLRDRVGAVLRHVRYGDTARTRRCRVDDIVSGSEHGDEAQLRQLRERLPPSAASCWSTRRRRHAPVRRSPRVVSDHRHAGRPAAPAHPTDCRRDSTCSHRAQRSSLLFRNESMTH